LGNPQIGEFDADRTIAPRGSAGDGGAGEDGGKRIGDHRREPWKVVVMTMADAD
jgi:hypothetical protein